MTSWRVVAVIAFALVPYGAGASAKCPDAPGRWSKPRIGDRFTVDFRNDISKVISLVWVGEDGREHDLRLVEPGAMTQEDTFAGHVFRCYAAPERKLVYEHEARRPESVVVEACDSLQPFVTTQETARNITLESLVLPVDQQCLPEGVSSKWSCTRVLAMDDVLAREPEMYGLPTGQNEAKQPDHAIVDTGVVQHIINIPRVSPKGPGFLRMSFTPPMREVLEWWRTVDKAKMNKREFVPGGYTNGESVEMSILTLDRHRQMKTLITSELQRVLEWWTGLPLKHTATYGVRTYHRGSVLVDHVDREDTHIASAVLQVAQDVDEDGGWPLEVLLQNGEVGEVYLQPGEMVLYEGAWLRHGRPMRFRGDSFSNVFVHFRPSDWGDTKSKKAHRYYGAPFDRFDTIADRGITSSKSFLGPRGKEL